MLLRVAETPFFHTQRYSTPTESGGPWWESFAKRSSYPVARNVASSRIVEATSCFAQFRSKLSQSVPLL